MAATATIAASLLQAGLLLGTVLLVQLVAVRHLPAETIPGVLRERISLCNRLRPWLIGSAAAMAAVGVLLR